MKGAARGTATTEYETDPRNCYPVTIPERDNAARAIDWPSSGFMATFYATTKRAEWLHGLSIDEFDLREADNVEAEFELANAPGSSDNSVRVEFYVRRARGFGCVSVAND